jgi:hypothetical protein
MASGSWDSKPLSNGKVRGHLVPISFMFIVRSASLIKLRPTTGLVE